MKHFGSLRKRAKALGRYPQYLDKLARRRRDKCAWWEDGWTVAERVCLNRAARSRRLPFKLHPVDTYGDNTYKHRPVWADEAVPAPSAEDIAFDAAGDARWDDPRGGLPLWDGDDEREWDDPNRGGYDPMWDDDL